MEELVVKHAEESDKSPIIEEITENISIAIAENKMALCKHEMWKEQIIPMIHTIAKLRKTESAKYPGMSTRASFKYMDIIDSLKTV